MFKSFEYLYFMLQSYADNFAIIWLYTSPVSNKNLLILICPAVRIICFSQNKLSPLPGFELRSLDPQAIVLPIEPSLPVSGGSQGAACKTAIILSRQLWCLTISIITPCWLKLLTK